MGVICATARIGLHAGRQRQSQVARYYNQFAALGASKIW
jgi:hypothetical protein